MALCGLLEQNDRGVWQLKLIELNDTKRILQGESFDCEAKDVIDVTLDYFINESREVQRLYYWANGIGMGIILLDIAQLGAKIANDLSKEARAKLMGLFSASAWRALLDIVDSNVGSLLRNEFSGKSTCKTDSWIYSVQNLQMALLMPEIYGFKVHVEDVVDRIQSCIRVLVKNYGEISKDYNLLSQLDDYMAFCSRNIELTSQADNFALFTKVCSKAAQLLSIEKLLAYESRQNEYMVPGCFQSLSYKILSSSFKHLNDKNVAAVFLLSHILGAYSVRECCMRYISLFLANELRQVVFKTTDECDTDIVRSISYAPKSLQQYMLQLVSTRSSEIDDNN